jgi:DNA invertase Pin-like site-specific DNA recombinase
LRHTAQQQRAEARISYRFHPRFGDFNSLDAQREASEAYIKSQAHEGWRLIRDRYDDGGFSGGSMERPALQKLLCRSSTPDV